MSALLLHGIEHLHFFKFLFSFLATKIVEKTSQTLQFREMQRGMTNLNSINRSSYSA